MRPRLRTVDSGRGAYRATALVRRSSPLCAVLRLTARISDHKHTARWHREPHEAPSQDTSTELPVAAYGHRRGGPKAEHTARGCHQTVCGKFDGRVCPEPVISLNTPRLQMQTGVETEQRLTALASSNTRQLQHVEDSARVGDIPIGETRNIRSGVLDLAQRINGGATFDGRVRSSLPNYCHPLC